MNHDFMEIKVRLECGKKVTDRATDRATDRQTYCSNIIIKQLFALKLVSHKTRFYWDIPRVTRNTFVLFAFHQK